MSQYKAVVFDIGGVVAQSPLAGIAKYEKKHGIPVKYIDANIAARNDSGGAFQRMERGELHPPKFYAIFGAELSEPGNIEVYKKYLKLKGRPIPDLPKEGYKIDGEELFHMMMGEAKNLDPLVVNAIKKLNASGKFKVAALTNNYQPAEGADKDESILSSDSHSPQAVNLRELFHEFVESSKTGMRKPNPKIYQHTCDLIGVKLEESIFLDDIGTNLKAAKKLGMATIQVNIGESRKAIQQLEKLTGLSLIDDSKL
ncbi:hypothetical protein SmJEL517_g00668 [Synchytrium microbalum]|uniref:Epoxide hydrolase n=1 Tax=Synchytrium microbalum TaxID=1806994 RepID=A0A507CEZ4_9FUNG|nr:uncharacterized protein SmJEL517_g00668 [Synchytrium microbalum]TPX37759.1 hypothetical protein SmJEL517_g00668 [Synchytrium microbalum]